MPPRKPWPLQQEAIDEVIQGFSESGNDRGKLIMACGTGKTYTALQIAEKLAPDNSNILFIAPSIALVAQTRREWLRNSNRKLSCTVICSDSTAGRQPEDIDTSELSCEVTTDPSEIANNLLKEIPDGAVRCVFCTYQSLDKLRDAQHEHGVPVFDLAIVDEAHRTTGYLDSDRSGQFQLIHKADEVRAKKRLYMTATPRIYDKRNEDSDSDAQVVDMNSVATYGPEFYRLTFKKSVEHGMLCDYRVIALGIAEDCMTNTLKQQLLELNDEIGGAGKAADEQAFLALGAIALAINGVVQGENSPGVLSRTIGYASNIRRSKWFAQALTNAQVKSWITRTRNQDAPTNNSAPSIHTKHLDGTSSALERNAALRRLNNGATVSNPHLITNAQLFTEGVDVPALNAIAFLDPRKSKVDTIQAVGRVMRRDDSSGKAMGYIVVPVILPPGADLIDTLTEDQSRYKSLGNVLRALQSHDERLYTELTERLTFATIKPENRNIGPDPSDYVPVQASLLDEDAKQAIFAQIAKKTGIAQRGKIIADAITQAIQTASSLFIQEGATGVIARTIATPEDNEQESCKTAALLIANACIMHRRLEETGNLRGIPLINEANRVPHPISVLLASWASILQKDYAPIFQDACALLENMPDNEGVSNAIKTLIQCAIDNATQLNDLGFDHAGPLYHKVLGNARSDGAFYTKNISAHLLAGLAFDNDLMDWSNKHTVRKIKVIDPACGTGTLLMAALHVIKRRVSKACGLNDDQINQLHKMLVENSIYGLDINKYSVQLAACNLTIGAPNTDYQRINLHTLQHGPVSGTDGEIPSDVRHGVLEHLLDDNMGGMLIPPPKLHGSSVMRSSLSNVSLPSKFNVVICNPPFTETLNQSERRNPKTKSAMADRLKEIKISLEKRNAPEAKAIGKRSIQPYFTPLITKLLPNSKAMLAMVVPTTVCVSENARAQRQYLASNFHIEMVVTSHDPKHVNFSENTSIHECLVIGKRSEKNDKPTRFIQLSKFPNGIKESDKIIEFISMKSESPLYAETLWPADKVNAGDWTPVQWFNPQLAKVASKINSLNVLHATSSLHHWKIKNATFYTTFDYELSDEGNCFCTINESDMQSICVVPETRATPKPGKENRAELSYSEADYVLSACRFRTTSSRITAVYTEKPAIIGGAFSPIGVNDKNTAKAYAAFLNSTYGIIQLLNRRNKMLTYINFETGQMKTLKLPDPRKVDYGLLVGALEQVQNARFERLAKCNVDPARKILDHTVSKALGMDPAETDEWREWLSQEPTITNKPFHGLENNNDS